MFWLYRFNKSYKVVSLGKSEFLAEPVAADLDALGGDLHQCSDVFRRESEPEQRREPLFLLGKVRKVFRKLCVEILMQSLRLSIEKLRINIPVI